MATMKFVLVGPTVVIVYAATPPSDNDYDMCLAYLKTNMDRIEGALVYSAGSGPLKALQRQAAARLWLLSNKRPRIALLTHHTLVKGMFTSLSWLIGSSIRVYSPGALHEAATFVRGPAPLIEEVLSRFCVELGIVEIPTLKN